MLHLSPTVAVSCYALANFGMPVQMLGDVGLQGGARLPTTPYPHPRLDFLKELLERVAKKYHQVPCPPS